MQVEGGRPKTEGKELITQSGKLNARAKTGYWLSVWAHRQWFCYQLYPNSDFLFPIFSGVVRMNIPHVQGELTGRTVPEIQVQGFPDHRESHRVPGDFGL